VEKTKKIQKKWRTHEKGTTSMGEKKTTQFSVASSERHAFSTNQKYNNDAKTEKQGI